MRDVVQSLTEWFTHPITVQLTVLMAVVLGIHGIATVARRSVGQNVRWTEVRYSIQKAVTLTGYLLMALAAAVIFKDHLDNVAVAVGVAGAGIAVALQEVIISLAGWLSISLGNLFKPGDRIQLAGIKGDVIDISMQRTTLMELGEWVHGDLYSGRIVRVSNGAVFKEPLYNYSGEFEFLWDEIRVPIKYGSDATLARATIEEAATAVLGDYIAGADEAWKKLSTRYMVDKAAVNPRVTLELNDNWIEFTLRYVVDYRTRRSTRDRLFTTLLHLIEATGNRVALASATFHLVEAPVINVRLHPLLADTNEAMPVASS